MVNDKSKQDFRDREQVAADEDDEVEYLAKRHRISPGVVRQLIRQHGSDRKALEHEVRKLRS
ncbi:DUF3606 domain-containing protein [Mesorhizobium sp.]|uniref:DUF3606 domain-containing protein n=1 Tax=Mesorhizobium sp. TaxID=1871066 RepID=UPI0025E65617|nr:DUF3606 domain-containing protein [Mesorhizobium sp.]